MGNYPASMKNVPDTLRPNQVLKMTNGKDVYLITPRSLGQKVTNNFMHNLLPKQLGNFFKQTNEGYFIVTKNNVNVITTASNNLLKVFIMLFKTEQNLFGENINLDNVTFELLNTSSFGKKKKMGSIDADIKYLKN